MTSSPDFSGLTFKHLSESAFLARIGDGEQSDPAITEAVVELTARLDRVKLAGVLDVVPSYANVLVEFDPLVTEGALLEQSIREISQSTEVVALANERTVIIPVAYGGEYGPDLAELSEMTGLAPDEVCRRHAAGSYRVACTGFSPGWAYLVGLPPELAAPRLNNPRPRVIRGSVGIGGQQTGVYSLDTPGGWRLIGRTPIAMFDPNRDEPQTLLQGDNVKFAPISLEHFHQMADAKR